MKRIIVGILVLLATAGGVTGYILYQRIYGENVELGSVKSEHLYIPTGSEFDDVVKLLLGGGFIVNGDSFRWVAEKMNYVPNVKPGRYLVTNGMNNKQLVGLLRSGDQDPVQVTFNNIRTKESLASVISQQIEADSLELVKLLSDPDYLDEYDLDLHTSLTLFIPNTYEFYWNTSASQFIERMENEHSAFWTAKRISLADKIKLNKAEVSILASIVEQETTRNDEKKTIAGVYMNRYLKGWKLEADPTLVFANGDFTINRVLNKHKEIDSPYNTYMYEGLPPGPICIPSISSLDAVLNYEHHNYMFFCAKSDFSGYHAFARNYNEHLRNAREFQRELNRRNIKS